MGSSFGGPARRRGDARQVHNRVEERVTTMTDAVNRLTDPATLEPSFSAGAVRGLLMAFERLGHDVAALLAAAGIRATELGDPDGRIACRAIGAVFAAAQQRRPTANLWLRLAEETPLGAFPLIDYLIVTAATVGAGLHRYAHYARLTGAPLRIDIHEDEQPIRVNIDTAAGTPEYAVCLTVLHLQREAEGTLVPSFVSFTHRPDDPQAFEAALHCPVRSNAAWNGLALSSDAWQLPFRRRDLALQGVLERHARDVLARIPAGDDVATELRRVLASRVTGGDTRIASAARAIGTSVRSLQRRLAQEGLSYQEVLDRCRCEAAERHLADRSLSIAEISWLTGYSEPSAFHRAFRRWRGVSAQVFREQQQEAGR